jgi:hypothetical protein
MQTNTRTRETTAGGTQGKFAETFSEKKEEAVRKDDEKSNARQKLDSDRRRSRASAAERRSAG